MPQRRHQLDRAAVASAAGAPRLVGAGGHQRRRERILGLAALPIELPVTTTLMLRAIADIARHHGEDLSTLEARLACVEVFALGATAAERRMDVGYYASRALLSRLAATPRRFCSSAASPTSSAPVVGGLVAEIATALRRRRLRARGRGRIAGARRARRRDA